MRVHGKTKIRRRTYREPISTQAARDMLREDFYELCGYCGKNGQRLRQRFHADHFVPKSLDKEREWDYSNFVWACPKCNQIKYNKWPTGDKAVAHTETVGFVDPAEEEFDRHLCRDKNGDIVGCTALGDQMCRLLNFHQRMTGFFWKVNELCDRRDALRQRHQEGNLSLTEYQYYADLDILLGKIMDALYEKGE